MASDDEGERKVPWIDENLIRYLSEQYPDVHPDGNETHQSILIKWGELRVVRHLKRLYEDQLANQFGVTK